MTRSSSSVRPENTSRSSRWRLAWVLSLLVAAVALAGGCDDSVSRGAGDRCQTNEDCAIDEVCDPETERCEPSDLRMLPDVSEPDTGAPDIVTADTAVADTGQDVTPDVPAPGCEPEGAERPCGVTIGECVSGVEQCVEGEWIGCTATEPTEEVCDGLDNDCNGQTDEFLGGDSCGSDVGECLPGVEVCTGVDGMFCKSSLGPWDEVCDGRDNDCDGETDEADALDPTTWYADVDGDGFGDASNTTTACTAPIGYIADSTDCNDDPAAGGGDIYPGAPEICDGVIDHNCANGIADELTATYHRDADGDGFGDAADSQTVCGAPSGYVLDDTDCNDSPLNGSVDYPGAPELCDGRDNNCVNGITDEPPPVTYFLDSDGDGFGDPDATRAACAQPLGYVTINTDCEDDPSASGGSIYPGAPECSGAVSGLPDGLDNDCDGIPDNGCSMCQVGVDNDFDGANQCDDCDDTNGGVFPGAVETCNGLDDDCDGGIDEDFDADGDTYSTCSKDPLVRDCNDTPGSGATVYPGAPELCNGADDDCDGYIDEGCLPCDPNDTDGDGVSECDGDCDPDNGDVWPRAPEVCDGVDNDCNLYTVANCDVSEPCNFDIDGDGDDSDDPDICNDDLLCVCIITGQNCTGNYRCTSLCGTSADDPGPAGVGCEADQTCALDLLQSAAVHGCSVTTDPLGALAGGASCGADEECRSGSCDRLCVGPGCNPKYCQDFCGRDADCAPGAICLLNRVSSDMDGVCWPAGGVFLGSTPTGAACSADTGCDHGFCSVVTGECTQPCCGDADCPSGLSCSLRGDQINTNFVTTTADVCNNDGDCDSNICFNGACAYRLTESSPMCVPDLGGQGTRQAGAACSSNTECISQFCDRELNVCVESCCGDSGCPNGLSCELQMVSVGPDNGEGRVTQARICVNLSSERIYEPY